MSGTVVCLGCGVHFEAKRIDAMWCPACRIKREKEKGSRYERKHKEVCPGCGQLKCRGTDYCRQCSNKYRGTLRTGSNNGNWRGGRTVSKKGYILVRVRAPGEKGQAYRAEHIVIWEQTHNEPLPEGWVVHHLNGIKDDNRPENLLALPRAEHHRHPYLALKPYQARIQELERQLKLLA